MKRVLAAFRAMPWAIQADVLPALEDIVHRAYASPELVKLANDGHEERYKISSAAMGSPMPNSRKAFLRDGIASIPVHGPIFPRSSIMTEMSGATSIDVLSADFRAALANPEVKAVVLAVDSPGGAVAGVSEFASEIAAANKPVIAHITGLGASAAYWIASQADEIVIDETGVVGSIGVVISGRQQEAADSNGYREYSVVSSNAINKRPDISTEEGQAEIQAYLNEIESVFISAVSRGRDVSKRVVVDEFGQGGVKVGRIAKAAGMVDRVDTLESTLSRLSKQKPRTKGVGPRRAQAELNARKS